MSTSILDYAEKVRAANLALEKTMNTQEHLLAEQDKLLQNLIEENERLKKANRPEPDPVPPVRWGRNKSWRHSAWLGIREGIWLAPSRLAKPVTLIVVIVYGLAAVLAAMVVWIMARPFTLLAGLAGMLVENERTK